MRAAPTASSALSAFNAIGAWGRTRGDDTAASHEDHPSAPGATHLRAVFISDLHLGTPGCQADALLDFLRAHPSDNLYLVGDIVDGWQLRRRWYWPQSHNDVVQKLLRRARKGCRVVFVPGNHDEFARAFIGHHVTDFEVAVAQEARPCGHQGVVCGHIHRAEMREINGTLYCNDGDWVESRTALVEHVDGRLELVHWVAGSDYRSSTHTDVRPGTTTSSGVVTQPSSNR